MVQKNLEVGEVLAVDAACIVAVTNSINVDIKYNGPMRRGVFGVSDFCIFWFSLDVLESGLRLTCFCFLMLFYSFTSCY